MPSETDIQQMHWDRVYATKAVADVSWYEVHAEKSLQLIRSTGVQPTDPIIDAGGGASFLVDELLGVGYRDLTVLDISATVLNKLSARLGPRASSVTLLHQDVTSFQPPKCYALWHDRAVFHFLVQPKDRERYINVLRGALRPHGHVIIATFGPSGPERCSGLPTMRYDTEALSAELGPEFELKESALVEHRTPWNTSQQFLYCRFNGPG